MAPPLANPIDPVSKKEFPQRWLIAAHMWADGVPVAEIADYYCLAEAAMRTRISEFKSDFPGFFPARINMTTVQVLVHRVVPHVLAEMLEEEHTAHPNGESRAHLQSLEKVRALYEEHMHDPAAERM